MTTLVARLSGPIQSWGEHAKFSHRTTLPYPSYAGLLGLARAALGYTRYGTDARTGQPADDGWLRDLAMAVRIDQRGRTMVDYHTVNPPPVHRYHWLDAADRRRLATVPMGNGKPWTISVARGDKKVPEQQTLVTTRTYLTDAAFTWFIHGSDKDIRQLTDALETPYWQLSLGRKACLPDQPLLLGTTEKDLRECAEWAPATGEDGRRELHVIASAADGRQPPKGRPLTHVDLPMGPHPHDGYGYLTRFVSHVTPPIRTRLELLTWAKEELR